MTPYYRLTRWAACGALAVFTLGCSQQPPTPPDTRADDAANILQTDMAWSKAAAAKQLDGMLAYYADDAFMFPDNGPMATGKDAIRETWDMMLSDPNFSISWQPTKVEVARSGDMGYSHGTYQTTMNDAKGKPVTSKGKYVVVWKKQADGSWKAVDEIANSDT